MMIFLLRFFLNLKNKLNFLFPFPCCFHDAVETSHLIFLIHCFDGYFICCRRRRCCLFCLVIPLLLNTAIYWFNVWLTERGRGVWMFYLHACSMCVCLFVCVFDLFCLVFTLCWIFVLEWGVVLERTLAARC